MVSVIVPVYKVENYLSTCVESIMGQTYDDIEIILVDDGSPDKCPSICDEYAEKDRRIKVVHKENGGLSSARNAGIEVASGEWLVFIDSDDYVDRDMLKKMMEVQETTRATIVVCDFVTFPDGKPAPKKGNKRNEIITYSPIEAAGEFFSRKGIGWNAWNKMYHCSLFQTVRFPDGVYCEDKATIYKLYLLATKVTYIKEALYYYRIRSGSIMRDKPARLYFDTLKINEEICEYMKPVDENLYTSARAYAAKCALFYYVETRHNKKLKDVSKLCLAQIRKYYPCVKNASFLSCIERLFIYICSNSIKDKDNSIQVSAFGFLYDLARRR